MLAREKYVKPALEDGDVQFTISVRAMWNDLQAEGLPVAGRTPQICSALQTKKFLKENGLEIENVVGPRSKVSPTVVVHYRVVNTRQFAQSGKTQDTQSAPAGEETPGERARRLTEKLRGLLKEELAEYGGAEGFIRWVRGYDEEDAA
ncbi:MAG: hypothetical protein ACRD25_01880 [Terracidiphilus sp.]